MHNANQNNKDINKITKYGEQVPTLFSWISPDEQKKRAEHLEHITERKIAKDKKRKNKDNRPS